MSALAEIRRRVRGRAEHALREAAMQELGRQYPASTVPPSSDRRDVLWRVLFVPLYRRVPWSTKVRAMHALGMTAEHSGWTPPDRRPREPWRPPATTGPDPGA
jgi:hypothetical protein